MRSSRLVVSAAASMLFLGLLAGCSGDETEDADPSAAIEEQRGECEAEVTVTGAVKASWTGEAFVVTENRSGPTLYKSADGQNTLTLLGADGDFPAIASLSTKKGNFTGGDGTLDIDAEGSGAAVETTLSAGGEKSADLVATITC